MESMVPGSSKSFFTSVDLPDPEGPEMIKISGSKESGMLFDVLHLFAQFFDFRLQLQSELCYP